MILILWSPKQFFADKQTNMIATVNYSKVEIELRVVQFWTEIKLVITNRTPASRSSHA